VNENHVPKIVLTRFEKHKIMMNLQEKRKMSKSRKGIKRKISKFRKKMKRMS
jgi:hypothetical protein